MPRPFTQVLAQLRFGELDEELTTKLAQLTLACAERGRSGTLQLTIHLKPGKAGQMEIVDEVRVKAPEAARGATLMFATPEGSLQRTDPRQLSLDGVRVVDRGTGEIIDVQHKAG